MSLTRKWRNELAGGQIIEGAEAAAQLGVAQAPLAVQPAYMAGGRALIPKNALGGPPVPTRSGPLRFCVLPAGAASLWGLVHQRVRVLTLLSLLLFQFLFSIF